LLQIEWTNQHGCGGNEDNDQHKLNCNIVLQYLIPETFTTQTGEWEYPVGVAWSGMSHLASACCREY